MSARVALVCGLGVAASALGAGSAALAQDADLRGGLPVSEAGEDLAGARSVVAVADDASAQADGFRLDYTPPATLPDEEADAGEESASIFDDAGSADDPFAAAPVPAARALSTARARSLRGSANSIATGPTDERTSNELEEDAATIRVESLERSIPAEPDNRRAEAVEARYSRPKEDPYAPLGLRLGTFIVRASLEQGLGWTSNASSSPAGSSAVLSETALRLNAVSDWSRHSAAFDAFGIFRESLSGEEVSDPEAGVNGDLILDLGEGLRGLASGGYALRPESATSPVDLPPTTSRPLRQTLTGSLGLEKDAGKFRFGITGNVEKQQYGDADLLGGGGLSQRERDFVLTTAVLRTGYQISPALTPFLEAELGRRAYDLGVDSDGYYRSATRTGARAGLALDLGEKFFGEFSAGWLREDIDDSRLAAISALSLSADLYWSPMRGTLVGLRAATSVEGATAPGESGSVLYTGGLSVERQMRANLTGNALLGVEWRDYSSSDGYDLTLSAEAGLTWWFNRHAGLTGRARHETVKSDDGRETETNSVFLGLKLQR